MAGLLLAGLGSWIGAGFGGTILGLSGAAIGQAIGVVVGNAIDQYLFTPTLSTSQEGPRLETANVMTSVEGVNILRGYGRFKVAGNVIWASRLREEVVKETTKSGGKGGVKSKSTTTAYNYYANFAVGLCEGEIMNVHRVWADGKLLDLSEYTYRIYRGTKTQMPDSLMETKEGTGNVPGYRGLAYIIFEDMLINDFGNRIPQLAFEITKPITRSDNNAVSNLVTGVDLIPGTTEFGYDPTVVEQVIYDGNDIVERRIENCHLGDGKSDWEHALDQMAVNLPNCNIVTFVVTWFGDDLRIGSCTIRPKVENNTKRTDPISWRVAGLDRDDALIISTFDGHSAFGGTPNDLSVYRAIIDLKARGYEVMLYPFIIMDVPPSNTLPNPYSDNAATLGQAAYPWRGRLTCSPASGFVGSVQDMATAATQINSFLGTATAANFSGSGGAVTYSGVAEWSFRRFVLHMAELCRQAGGVDYFCIGTEMVGATSIRSDTPNTYPFVSGLISLAAQVAALIPSAKLGYAADWSEYHSQKPTALELCFNLDPLWADANIDFIGIDNYLPLSDWRDSTTHLDYLDGWSSIYDLDYLKANVEGGEFFDWYYASSTDRLNQVRTPITDGAYGKHWVYRQKDIKSWWNNLHYNRTSGGTESGSSTAWVPQSKPIIFTEYGCPAINKGPNQPNVFFDPKSSESFVPYFSSGGRDDEVQRQYIRAMVEYWSDNTNNPASGVYSGRMVDKDRMNYWSYDARPWPTFPTDGNTWADQPNWQYGHWISGRIDAVYAPDLLNQLAEDYNVTADYDFSRAYGSCDGFVLSTKTSFRSTVEPLASLFMFDIIESGAMIKAVSQQEARSVVTVTLDDIAEAADNAEPVTLTRSQASELPVGMTIRFIDIFNDYEIAAVSQFREVVAAESEPSSDTPIVLDYSRAQQMVDRLLYSAWAKRTTGEFGLLPEFLYLESGDVVTVEAQGFTKPLRIESLTDGTYRQITAKSFDLGIFQPGGGPIRTQKSRPDATASSATTVFLDLPLLSSTVIPHQPYIASYVNPWPGVSVYRSITNSNFVLDTQLGAPTIIGEVTAPFNAGPTDIWDLSNELKVKIYSGELETLDELNVLNGANAIAVQNSVGGWEIVQFVNASLTGTRTYTLTKLLRGQLGTEDGIEATIGIGARIVLLESPIQQLNISLSDLSREYYLRYGPADRDLGDSTYRTTTQTFVGRGLKPYSPVHIKGLDAGAGNIIISWVRRTRVNGDSWDYVDDVPLNEAFEKYEVDILNGGGLVVRTLAVTSSPQVTYTAAQQSSDGITAPFDVIVYQLSDQVGRGIGRRATING